MNRLSLIQDALLGFLAGVGSFYFLIRADFWSYLGIGLAAVLILKAILQGQKKFILLLLVFIIAGVGRAGIDSREKELPNLEQQKVEITGKITGIIPLDKWTNELRIQTSAMKIGDQQLALEAVVRAVVDNSRPYHWGDLVEASGFLSARNSVTTSFWSYLFKERLDYLLNSANIFSVQSGAENFWEIFLNYLGGAQKYFGDFFRSNLSSNSAALEIGILIGQRADFSKAVINDFAKTGLSHVLAISGFNIALVIGLLEKLLEKRVGKWWRFGLIFGLVVIFSIFTGSSASVIRAAIMGMIALLVKYSGRPGQAGQILIMTVVIMVLANPRILNFDVGFQLSFLATWGLLIFMPKLETVEIPKIPDSLKEILFATLAALILTLPVMMIDFGQISLIAFPANLIVLPFIPLMMFLGVALLAVKFLLPVFLAPAALGISVLGDGLIFLVGKMAQVSFLTFNFDAAWAPLWLGYYFWLFIAFGRPKLAQSSFWPDGVPRGSVSIPESEKRRK